MNEQLDNSIITVRNINIPFSIQDGNKDKICKETDFNNTIKQLHLMDIYRTIHSKSILFYCLVINRNVLHTLLEAENSKIKVPAQFTCGEGLPGSQPVPSCPSS